MGEAKALRRQQRARTEVVDDDRAVLVREIGQGRRVRYLREAGLPEVGWMDPKDDTRPTFGQRRLEVRNPGPVRRPHLDELHAGSPQDLRYADAAADLDELAAPDDNAGALAGQADGQGDRRSVVVRDEGVLGAGQRKEMLLGCAETGAATACFAIQLEEEVVARGCGCSLDRRSCPRRPAEVGMDDHAGRVDCRQEPRLGERVKARCHLIGQGCHGSPRGSGREQLPLRGDCCSGDLDERLMTHAFADPGPDRREHLLDARRMGSGLGRHRSSWRERMGVEPTAPRLALRHWF